MAGRLVMASLVARTAQTPRSWSSPVAVLWRSVRWSLPSVVSVYSSYSDDGLDGRAQASPEASSAADPLVGTPLSRKFPPAAPRTATIGADRPAYDRNVYPLTKWDGFRVYRTPREGPFAMLRRQLSQRALNEEIRQVGEGMRSFRDVPQKSWHDSPKQGFVSGKERLIDSAGGRGNVGLPNATPTSEAIAILKQGQYRDSYMFVEILKRCSKQKDLLAARQLHEGIIQSGMDQNPYVMNTLLNVYIRCGRLQDARRLFDGLQKKDVVAWRIMIAGYAENGHAEDAMEIFNRMRQGGSQPKEITCLSVLKACASPLDLKWGKELHSYIRHTGLEANVRVSTALVHMYAKCGCIAEARRVFDNLTNRDVITWNVMIGAYAESGLGEEAYRLFLEMEREGFIPDAITYINILNASARTGASEWVKEVHGHARRDGLESDLRVGNALVHMYAKSGRIDDARLVFLSMEKRNVMTWTTMIGAYAESGCGVEAYRLFLQMKREGFPPNAITYVSILNASASAGALEWVKEVHGHACREGLDLDLRVGNALVHMYAKCASIDDARVVFDGMKTRDVTTWNIIIRAYSESCSRVEAYRLFLQMKREGCTPNAITYINILNSSASPGALLWVNEVHGHARGDGLEFDLRVGSALVYMYGKLLCIDDARNVFDGIQKRDVTTWNIMIGAYAESGCAVQAYQLFLQMERDGFRPNASTYVSILHPAASAGASEWVKEVHGHAHRAGLLSDLRVGNALVHMFAKSGRIDDARLIFDRMEKRDVVTWNIMIGGLGQHGCGHEALELFRKMNAECVKPDETSFVAVLSACGHAGLLDDGRRLFAGMTRDFGVEPSVLHYNCVVDLLGRAGHLEEAKLVIADMPVQPDGVTWKALLGACRTYGNVELGELAAEEVLKLEPDDASAYVLLSNIYAAAGKWEEVSSVRAMMQERGVRKEPGRSWIEVDDKIHEFCVADTSHPEAKAIYAELNKLSEKLKAEGYIPDTQLVLRNIGEEDKELALCSHSERLAIAYGLMRTPRGQPIRVYKNLRVCSDCHRATRFISKITGREIIARDANRFHHFKNGVCSCGDYW